MKKEKSYVLLIVSIVLLIAAAIFAYRGYHTSYQDSKAIATELSAAKEVVSSIQADPTVGDLTEAKAIVSSLTDKKLSAERPYSYGLIALFISIILLVKGILDATVGVAPKKTHKVDINRLAQAGLLAALCYIGFAFFKIDVPVGTEKTAFHFGNVFCVLAALFLGGFWGGMAGAVGMTIGDLTTAYVTSAPKTFILKLAIGLIVGLVAHKIFKLSRDHKKEYITGVAILASFCGMAFNTVADPVVGYFYKTYLLGVPQDLAKALAKVAAGTTLVNSILAITFASIFYLALRPALKKSGLFVNVTPEPVAETAAEAAPDQKVTAADAKTDVK